jgi:hypothetical protein
MGKYGGLARRMGGRLQIADLGLQIAPEVPATGLIINRHPHAAPRGLPKSRFRFFKASLADGALNDF